MRTLAPCSCQEQALGPRLRGDDEPGGVTHANFRNEVLGSLSGSPDHITRGFISESSRSTRVHTVSFTSIVTAEAVMGASTAARLRHQALSFGKLVPTLISDTPLVSVLLFAINNNRYSDCKETNSCVYYELPL